MSATTVVPHRERSAPPAPGELLDALHAIQKQHGYVPRSEAFRASRELRVPLARIFEVLTFYSFFRLEAPGAVTVSVCNGTSCHLQEGQALLQALQEILGITPGQTTTDGRFFLNAVRCLGCCCRSPVLMVDDRIYSNVQVADIPGILQHSQGGKE